MFPESNLDWKATIMTDALAHSGGHLLATHLQSVATKAADFSVAFEPAAMTQRWAYVAGLWRAMELAKRMWYRHVE